MKHQTLCVALVLTALLFAGCVEPTPTVSSPTPSSSAPTTRAATEPFRLAYGFDGNTTTTNATLNYTVESDQGISVELTYDGTAFDGSYVEGRYAWTLQLAYGTKPFQASIATPDGTIVHAMNITRLAATQITIDWGTFHPDSLGAERERIYPVLIDIDSRPSTASYQASQAAQSDFFTVHDQLQEWSNQTGVPIDVTYFPSLQGFAVDQIDGAGGEIASGYPPSWCYKLNGVSGPVGMSMARLGPDDRVEWILGSGFC